MASATPDLRLPSQPQSITAFWPVIIYTAWWTEAHVCVCVCVCVLASISNRVFWPRICVGYSILNAHSPVLTVVCVCVCVWTTCPWLLREVQRLGVEPATYWLQVRCPNHYATTPLHNICHHACKQMKQFSSFNYLRLESSRELFTSFRVDFPFVQLHLLLVLVLNIKFCLWSKSWKEWLYLKHELLIVVAGS